jgi:hypothetical protein
LLFVFNCFLTVLSRYISDIAALTFFTFRITAYFPASNMVYFQLVGNRRMTEKRRDERKKTEG